MKRSYNVISEIISNYQNMLLWAILISAEVEEIQLNFIEILSRYFYS